MIDYEIKVVKPRINLILILTFYSATAGDTKVHSIVFVKLLTTCETEDKRNGEEK